MNDLPIIIRSATWTDEPLIISSYLKSQRSIGNNSYMKNDVYFNLFTPVIQNILHNSIIVIAADQEDTSHIYGWISYALPSTIHYVYVKHSYRRFGVGRMLYELINPNYNEIYCTHTCRLFDNLKDQFKLIYNPMGDK